MYFTTFRLFREESCFGGEGKKDIKPLPSPVLESSPNPVLAVVAPLGQCNYRKRILPLL